MKPSTVLIALSLAANIALAAVFVFRPSLAPPAFRDFLARRGLSDRAPSLARPSSAGATAAPVPSSASAPADLWSSLQTDDLKSLVARLRAAGLPPAMIRAIVSAQIEQQFSARMKNLVGSPEQYPFWKPDPLSGNSSTNFIEEYSRISRERSVLMRQLLGDDFLAGSGMDPTESQRRQYGDLPKQKIEQLERILADYADMTSQARAAMRNVTLPEDQEKIAFLERERRKDLAGILTPQELEEYEMRSSTTTSRLRQALTAMDASEAEFRTLFRIQHPYSDLINPTVGIRTPELAQQRTDATARMNEEIRAALGDQRYAEYTRASNNEYQQLTRLAQRENIPIEIANRTYALRDTVAQESNRIAADASLNPDQKLSALQTLAQTTRTQIVGALGKTAGEGYIQSANWLSNVERGMAVTFGPNNQTSFKPVAPASAAGGRGGAAPTSGFIIQSSDIITVRPRG